MSDWFIGNPARVQITFWQEWSEWLPPYSDFNSQSWYNFSLFQLTIEHSPYKGSTEIELHILGLCGVVRWIWNTHALDEVKAIRDEFLATHREVEEEVKGAS